MTSFTSWFRSAARLNVLYAEVRLVASEVVTIAGIMYRLNRSADADHRRQ